MSRSGHTIGEQKWTEVDNDRNHHGTIGDYRYSIMRMEVNMNDAYNYSMELGLTEAEALALAACNDGAGASRDNILRIAQRKGLPSTKPIYPLPEAPQATPRPIESPVSGKLPVKRRKARKVKG